MRRVIPAGTGGKSSEIPAGMRALLTCGITTPFPGKVIPRKHFKYLYRTPTEPIRVNGIPENSREILELPG